MIGGIKGLGVKREKMKSEKVKTKAMALLTCAVFLAAMSGVSLASTDTNTQGKQSGIFEKKEFNHAPSAVEYVPNEILVKFKSDVGEDAINKINSEYGTSVKSTLLSGAKILKIPSDKTVDEMVRIYDSLPEVEYAEPNYIDHAFIVPNAARTVIIVAVLALIVLVTIIFIIKWKRKQG